ncbi:MAG TPA: hypothetical protein VG273_01665 [Bryobacteraceae bacterium]|nr:hypothetical protein [Bryobacteraceae bacterium]
MSLGGFPFQTRPPLVLVPRTLVFVQHQQVRFSFALMAVLFRDQHIQFSESRIPRGKRVIVVHIQCSVGLLPARRAGKRDISQLIGILPPSSYIKIREPVTRE